MDEKKTIEMMNDDNVSFDDFYNYLRDEEAVNWDRINSEEIVKMYCTEMMNDGIHISHIIKVLEDNPSNKEVYGICLGNSMNTPTPINTKKDLFRELRLS